MSQTQSTGSQPSSSHDYVKHVKQ